MHLLMQNNNKFGKLLPNVNQFNREIKQNFQTADVFNDKVIFSRFFSEVFIFLIFQGFPEFVAGDTRVLENPILQSFHTTFARLHNLAADEFTKELIFKEY